MTHDIQLSKEKAIEIIEFYITHSEGSGWDKIENLLIKKGILEDCNMIPEMWSAVASANNDLLTEILGLI